MRNRWNVRVPAGFWMAGLHVFPTRKAAQHFIEVWQRASPEARADLVMSYDRGEKFREVIHLPGEKVAA